MQCRSNCGACCIAPSINTPFIGMPNGKPANTACVHLDLSTFQCAIWQTPHYPEVCQKFQAEESVCGESQAQAITIIRALESVTHP